MVMVSQMLSLQKIMVNSQIYIGSIPINVATNDADQQDANEMGPVIDNRDLGFNNVQPLNVTNNGPDYQTMLNWPCHFDIEKFSSCRHGQAWFNINAVRVEHIWKSDDKSMLYLFLLDKTRSRIAAVVPHTLIQTYENIDLLGRVFAINHFQVQGRGFDDYPRYNQYSFNRDDQKIIVNSKTSFFLLTGDIIENFPCYPNVPTIRSLAEDKTSRRMLIDVVGIVSKGELRRYTYRFGSYDLYLTDATGQEMKLIFYHDPRTLPVLFSKAIIYNWIVYVSRVKLIHTGTINPLSSTNITNIEFNPKIPEAAIIKRLDDMRKAKRKEYNHNYYAQRKLNNKMRRLDDGDV